jgi:DNA-binding MarR family transcriptional regulator
MTAENPVEPVIRALQVLEALNRKPASSLGEMHAVTGLPKPTLVRLLGTLIAAGYATRISSQAGYRITGHVLALSSGLRFIDRIVDAAVPAMSEFTRDHAWPLALAKVRDGVVALLHSTGSQSPFSFERVGYNMTYQLMYTAMGQAHLAFCDGEERKRLIRALLPDPKLELLGLRTVQWLCGDANIAQSKIARPRNPGAAGTPGSCLSRLAFSTLCDDARTSRRTVPRAAQCNGACHCKDACCTGSGDLRLALPFLGGPARIQTRASRMRGRSQLEQL